MPELRDVLLECLRVSEEDLRELEEDMRYVTEQIIASQVEEEEVRKMEEMRKGHSLTSVAEEQRRSRLTTVGGNNHANLRSAAELKKHDAASHYLQMFEEEPPKVVPSLSSLSRLCVLMVVLKGEKAKDQHERCAGLFGWTAFHSRLSKYDKGSKRSVTDIRDELGMEWAARSFTRSSPMFHLFLKYWLEHVQLVQDACSVVPHLKFRSIFPYRSLVRAFLISYAESEDRPR